MKLNHLLRLSTLASLAALTSAQTKTIPAIAALDEGNDLASRVFARTAFRVQQVVDGAAIATNAATITAIGYRLDNDNSLGGIAYTFPNVTISLSPTTVSPSAMTTTFASNITGAPTVVFSGAINAPAYTSVPEGVDTFFPMAITPFSYAPSGTSLLIDIVATDPAPASLNRTPDGALPGGVARVVGSSGVTSNPLDRLQLLVAGNGPTQGRFSGMVPGGSFVLFVQAATAYQGLLMLGPDLPAPIDLGAYGAPANSLYVNPVVNIPFAMTSGIGGFRASWTLQPSAGTALAQLSAQAFVVDLPANPLGLVVTNARRMIIGEALPHPVNQLGANDPAAATGSLQYVSGILGGAVLQLTGTFL